MLIAETAKANSVPESMGRRSTMFAERELEAKIRTDERDRIARELHDSTSQLIVALQVQLMRLRQSSCVIKSDVFHNVMAELAAVIAELHDGVRRVSECKNVDSGSLGEALNGMASEFSRRTGLAIETEIGRVADALPSNVAGALFRVSQEALANAFRHAKPTHVSLSLTGDSRSVTLRVSDDGVGFHSSRGATRTGHGLCNMRARVDEVGGRLRVRNLKPGALVEAKVKLAAKPVSAFFHSSADEAGEIPVGYGSMRLLRTA